MDVIGKDFMLIIIKKIWRLTLTVNEKILQCFILLIMFRRKVDIDLTTVFKIYGIPFIKNAGNLKIGKIRRINSRYSENPIGGSSFCSFVVTKGATLIIDDGAGISNSSIYCSNNIYIGKNVYIGGDCKIYDTDFHSVILEKRLSAFDDDIKSAPVVIKSGVFIGTGTIIMKGVTIGERSVIGAGSVVVKSIPDNQIWAGNPAKFIKDLSNR